MPTDQDSGWVEPEITINGRDLTFAECMVMRLAVNSFLIGLNAPGMRRSLGGLAIEYARHLSAIEQKMREREP